MDDVEKIKQKLDIADVVGSYVTLKKSGRNFKANCPFHSEKTPSFYVSPERQVWYCFGCSKGGDMFTFIEEAERIEFPEALRILAAKAGVRLTQSYAATQSQKLKERILEINHLTSEFYHFLLTKHAIGKKALDYLHNRGIHDKTIKTFGLGYAPNAWEMLSKFLVKKGYTLGELEIAGLLIKGKAGRYYDRFRGRVMFPIRDNLGQTIAFAGRVLDPTIKEAKYINSPETPTYSKRNTLYGLDVTKEMIKKEGWVMLVEGEFDLLSSFQVGTSNVVAIKGSALSEGQIALLRRFTEKLVFALDSDVAGDEAARRGIELADKQGLTMRVVIPPTGKDPDECIRENEVAWKTAVAEAVPIYDYFISSSCKRFEQTTVEGKKAIADSVIPILSTISNPIIQGHYIRKLATLLDISEEQVSQAVTKGGKSFRAVNRPLQPSPAKPSISRRERLEEIILAVLLQEKDTSIIKLIQNTLDPTDFSTVSFAKLYHLAVESSAKKTLSLGSAIQAPQELEPALNRLLLYPLDNVFLSDEKQTKIARLVEQGKLASLRQKISETAGQISALERREATKENKAAALEPLQQQLNELMSKLSKFSEAKT